MDASGVGTPVLSSKAEAASYAITCNSDSTDLGVCSVLHIKVNTEKIFPCKYLNIALKINSLKITIWLLQLRCDKDFLGKILWFVSSNKPI